MAGLEGGEADQVGVELAHLGGDEVVLGGAIGGCWLVVGVGQCDQFEHSWWRVLKWWMRFSLL